MKTEFEADLREAFAARAAAMPVAAASRLRSMDYRPRERRLRTPVTVGAGVLASAGAAGAVLSVALGGAAPAYAGWSAAPTAASPSPSAVAGCQGLLPSTPMGPDGPTLGSGPWENVLTDVRGPFTVALFQNDGAYASCFTSSSFTETSMLASDGSGGGTLGLARGSASTAPGSGSGSGGGGSSGLSSISVAGETASGDLTYVTQSHLSTTSDGPYTLVDGRVGPGVTGVTLVLDDGQDVVTTVAHGWFVAWWPDDAGATSAQVASASGTTIEPLAWPHHGPAGPPASGTSGATGGSGNTGNSGGGATGNS